MTYSGAGFLRRRDIVALIAGTAVSCPFVARTQESDRIRRIGVLMNLPADHPDSSARDAAFRQTLRESGWTDGRNVKIEYRWGGADVVLYRRYAAELVAFMPDVIVGAASGWIVTELQRATHTVPIVIVGTMDPVIEGYVPGLARPGGNVTGFTRIEYSFSAKWLQLLKQIAPGVTRAAILRDPKWNGDHQFAAIEAAAPRLGVKLSPVMFTDAGKFESEIAEFADEPNGGVVVTAGTWATVNSQQIIALAAKHRLPAVYPNSSHVARGGLISYGPSVINEYRRAAGYVDRILRGAKPADLPVQAPTSYETVLNLKTAKALGLEVPFTVQALVDQTIE
jgi:putative ABC transport system substrate-binding protein